MGSLLPRVFKKIKKIIIIMIIIIIIVIGALGTIPTSLQENPGIKIHVELIQKSRTSRNSKNTKEDTKAWIEDSEREKIKRFTGYETNPNTNDTKTCTSIIIGCDKTEIIIIILLIIIIENRNCGH